MVGSVQLATSGNPMAEADVQARRGDLGGQAPVPVVEHHGIGQADDLLVVDPVPLQATPADEPSVLLGAEDPEAKPVLGPVCIVLHKPVLRDVVRQDLAIGRERLDHLRVQMKPTDRDSASRSTAPLSSAAW